MPKHIVTHDDIIRAEQKQELVLASVSWVNNPSKQLVWYPYTQTYEVRCTGRESKHTMERDVAIRAYNDLP
jgi:hypothetical protein